MAGAIAQWLEPLPCMQLNRVLSPTSCIVPEPAKNDFWTQSQLWPLSTSKCGPKNQPINQSNSFFIESVYLSSQCQMCPDRSQCHGAWGHNIEASSLSTEFSSLSYPWISKHEVWSTQKTMHKKMWYNGRYRSRASSSLVCKGHL